jgi:hypothetical protein
MAAAVALGTPAFRFRAAFFFAGALPALLAVLAGAFFFAVFAFVVTAL